MSHGELAFAVLARRYVYIIEQGVSGTELEQAVLLAIILSDLCGGALRLPDYQPTEGVQFPTVSLQALKCPDFRGLDTYREIYDPLADKEPVEGSLRDDLLDIYRDLKEGLLLFDSPDEADRQTAVWTWKLNFMLHWGEHATGALRVLHAIIRERAAESEGLAQEQG